jgi:hypothetical protein
MTAQMKFDTSGSRKAKDKKYDQSYGLDVNSRFFCGVSFSRLVVPNEVMPHMLGNRGS